MKIVFLSDDFPPQSLGGAGISTFELAAEIRRQGHDVHVITTCRRVEEAGESVYDGLRIHRIASDYPPRWRAYVSVNNPRAVATVGNILRSVKPDIVHVNNVHYYLSYASISEAKKYAKVIYTARDTMSICYGKLDTDRYLSKLDPRTTWLDHVRQAGLRWNPLRNIFIRRYLSFADARFAVSQALKDALAQNGIPNVRVLHTGMRSDDQNLSAEALDQFKDMHGLQGKKVLLFGGRVSAAKGGQVALRAFAEVAKKTSDAVLFVAGPSDGYACTMRKQAEGMGIGSKLLFSGWISREDMKKAYAAADVVLVPSLYLDPLPRVVLEAMASGKPVIGSRYGGSPEVIEDGVTGFIVPPSETHDLVEKIMDLLNNPIKSRAFGEAARKRIQEQFELEAKAKEYVAAYETLMAERQL